MILKIKNKYDKFTTRGIIYSSIASIGILYEILFSVEIRIILIAMYSIVIFIGMMCIFIIQDIS
jgi:hypothetical protein